MDGAGILAPSGVQFPKIKIYVHILPIQSSFVLGNNTTDTLKIFETNIPGRKLNWDPAINL